MITYIITGEDNEVIPRDVTHVSVDPSVKIIPRRLFHEHPNIVELICHDGVLKIELQAFCECPRLKRVIMPGVEEIENDVFYKCEELEYVECPKMETIGWQAFADCKSLNSINLSSAKIVNGYAFAHGEELTDVKFGKELEYLFARAFWNCRSLERITIPLKDGLIRADDIFQECTNLKRVDLVEEAILHETVAALLLDEWRNDMNEEIDSINHLLPNARAGEYIEDDGEKALMIREWIARVLHKIIDYKAQHRRILDEAAIALELVLPDDMVTNNVVPFLEFPLHTFDREGEDEAESSSSSDDDSEESYKYNTSEDEDGDEDDNGVIAMTNQQTSVDREDDEEQQHQQEEQEQEQQRQDDDDEVGRKRRKTANDDEVNIV